MKKLMAISAVLLTVGSLVYMVLANPHVPLVDANRVVLAETGEQGYCAGIVFGQTRGAGSASLMAECEDLEERDTEINWDAVIPEFCQGLNKSLQFSVEDCKSIMLVQQYWPTAEGSITNAWNRAFPYPGRPVVDSTPDGRGNDRDNNERDIADLSRP